MTTQQDDGALPSSLDERPTGIIHTKHGTVRGWLLEGLVDGAGTYQWPPATQVKRTHSWWRVMCLSGVDYFSTLGYQSAMGLLQEEVTA